MDVTTESLNAQFAALHAKREKEWPPEQLQRNIAQREALVAKYDPAGHIRPGDTIEPFELIEPDGVLTRDDLIADGPAVLIFFRYSGCPACNIALPYYNAQLQPVLKARGVRLVAISPQVPELLDIGARHNLDFTVASDPDNNLAKRIGIAFEPDEKPAVKPGDSWIGAATGTGTWELPQPTVLIIDQRGIVRFIEVSPDWLARTEAEAILAALDRETVEG